MSLRDLLQALLSLGLLQEFDDERTSTMAAQRISALHNELATRVYLSIGEQTQTQIDIIGNRLV